MKYIIIGFGGRGRLYNWLLRDKDAEIAALCDSDKKMLMFAKERLKLKDSQLYSSADKLMGDKIKADICFICTPDNMHKEHAVMAMNAGYDLLLEKPIANNLKDCEEILECSKKLNKKIFICHVLRYASFYTSAKKEIESGKYGKIINIDMTENVGYWHYAHSFVRGNWNNSEVSSPMIIAKCCHDLDIAQFLIEKKCIGVSSMGSLSFFNREHAPIGSAERCKDCSYRGQCAYDAYRYYLDERASKGNFSWPVSILAPDGKMETLLNSLDNSPYGKCVFKSQNNVADHQVVNMDFEDGSTAHLSMMAFSKDCYRNLHIYAEMGEIYGDTNENKLYCNLFGGESKVIDANAFSDTEYGHGGGDIKMLEDVLRYYRGEKTVGATTIEKSFASHYIGFNAEKSRLSGGALIKL